ncbi:peptide/nickel transport system substrate-binding protein [Stella humosa]|uniref:Peptide/nickel transport system substrate-binding protein n=1 Tax=Stella humosa TaxID=94 RepID=A0A3N1KLM2_9PROT|nr:ABC transporter substrate-binding protein [Stella humosa]ROP81264.1 peptide/nickel transport system substrate-binding protein [Stella humosa]BBK32612.1 peptide ABC transporter substrate-binding protein [Stella humosa]
MKHLVRAAAGALILAMAALPAAAQKKGGTLVMVVLPEPPTLASYLSTSGPIGQVAAKVYEGLLEYAPDQKPKEGLAKSWAVAADGKSITFKLQEGVTWHDGKPFTSADVKFTLMEVLKKLHPRGGITFQAMTDVETPDALTAVVKLDKPAPYFLSALSGYESPMLPKHLYEGTDIRNNPNANKPVGTGPFKFVSWERGQFVRLDRNPTYWRKGQPHLDRIVARFIADPGTRTAAMEKGEVHYGAFGAVPYVDVPRIGKLPTIGVSTDGYAMISPLMQLEVNTRKPPFDKVKVRQAVSYALDRKFMIDNIWFGFGKPSTGPISSNFKAVGLYEGAVRDYGVPDRVAIANKLLDEAEYPRGADGIRFKIVHDMLPYGDEWRRLGEYIKQALGDVGIDVTLRYEDVPTWLKRVFTDYDYNITSTFYYNLADPVMGVHRQYHSSMIRKGTVFVNGSGYSNPKVDKLLDDATVETDPAKRAAQYGEFQKILAEDVPLIFMTEMDFVTVYSKKVKGAFDDALGAYSSFAGVSLE